MNDSDSDSDSLMAPGYPTVSKTNNSSASLSSFSSTNRQKEGKSSTHSSSITTSSNTSCKRSSPKITYTGGSQQEPMVLDDSSSDSESSSVLEVLPPAKKISADAAVISSTSGVSTYTTSSTTSTASSFTTKAKKPPLASKATPHTNSLLGNSNEDSDSDDSLLLMSPGFKNKAPPSRPLCTTTKPSYSLSSQTITNSSSLSQKPSGSLKPSASSLGKERRKQDNLSQKQAEQARKKAERENLRLQKQKKKQQAAETRKRQRLESQVARGNFAKDEICLLVDPPLYQTYDQYDWREHDEITNHNLLVKEYRSALGGSACQTMQWIRAGYLQGGGSAAWEQLRKNNPQGYTHLDRLVVVMDDPKFFLELLQRTAQDDTDDDYPKLRQYLLKLEHGWRAAWSQTEGSPKVMLLLHRPLQEIDRQWVEFRKKYKNSSVQMANLSPPSTEEFHDALTWILIQYQVECMCCDSLEEIWTAALKMTRAIAKEPYHHPITELECINRKKPRVDPTKDHPIVVAQDVWFRQIQQIPRVSEIKARHLIQHYPTIQSLWQAYQEEDNPEELLAGCFSSGRNETKLSKSIYRLLTSTNPEEFPFR